MKNRGMLRDKKGDTQLLMPEVLRIILGVIAIVLLFVLAVKLVELMVSKNQIEQAKSTLNQIQVTMGNLQEGETEEYLVLSPKTWYLVYYPKTEAVPDKCVKDVARKEKENCLCICPANGADLLTEGPESIGLKLQNYIGPAAGLIKWAEQRAGMKGIPEFFKLNFGRKMCNSNGVCEPVEKQIVLHNPDDARPEINWIDFMNVPRALKFQLVKVNGEDAADVTSNLRPKKP